MKEPRATTRRALRAKGFREQQRRYETSGMSVKAFCRSEGLAESTFYQRRARLKSGKRTWHGLEAMPAGEERVGFIDAGAMLMAVPGDRTLGAEGEAPGEAAAGVEVRLELGGGLVLFVRRT